MLGLSLMSKPYFKAAMSHEFYKEFIEASLRFEKGQYMGTRQMTKPEFPAAMSKDFK